MVEYLWRASHRKPLQFGQCPCIFYGRLPALFPIAYMRHPSQSLSSLSSIDHREGQDRFQNEQTRRAARYALRASQSVVVSLSLSRRSRIWVRKKQWLVVSDSWFVKACHYTRMGCNRISQRAASHSCPFWQPSCTFRRSAPDGPKRLPGLAQRIRPLAAYFWWIFDGRPMW